MTKKLYLHPNTSDDNINIVDLSITCSSVVEQSCRSRCQLQKKVGAQKLFKTTVR